MNRYPPSRISPFVGFAAVAMSALTFILAVGVPSSLAPTYPDATTLAKSAPADVILPPIEVVATRDTAVANRHSKPRG